ncbi:protein kinase, putative [Leishmania tarentolae]|uniref:Protein kinase, putative n=1 Tax=Leishmania tarentolae TaxID=5689 RepID=A0A640KTQ6_LEITA|nr:protein kinase, putative [Leishmania tarentolae]
MLTTPSSLKLPSSGFEQGAWTRRIRKWDVYPSSLGAIRARAEALRSRWRDGGAANIIPITQAVCTPLYLRLEVDESLALELLGPSDEYERHSAPMAEHDAALCVFSVAQLLSRLHAVGVVHGHLQGGVVWHHTSDARRIVLTECELPMAALVSYGGIGKEARQCAAPEILRGDPYAGAADVWGLGVLLIQLLLGSSKPVCTADLENSDLLSPFLSSLGPSASSFVLPCLKSDPSARPLLHQVLQHPFLASAFLEHGTEAGDEEGSDDSSEDSSLSEGEELEDNDTDST